MDTLISFLVGFISKFPIISTVIFFMGTMRAIMKPLFVFLNEVTKVIPGEKDDELLKKVEESKIMKAIMFVLDYVGSIKLPQARK